MVSQLMPVHCNTNADALFQLNSKDSNTGGALAALLQCCVGAIIGVILFSFEATIISVAFTWSFYLQILKIIKLQNIYAIQWLH